ncbi:MAG: phosphatidylinositol mannoside acyltransferase [Firmicutes bacterium]|nr:phosphatidylinositol mannoside acyltransferase [Bacillota bacterium]
MVVYYIMKLISRFFCILPLKARYYSGKAIGSLGWLLVPKRRKKLAVGNIMRSFGVDRELASDIVKSSTTRFGNMLIEVLRFPLLNKSNINQLVTIKGREYLHEALAYGKGVVIATAHSGNWELLGPALSLNGFPVVGVAQKQTNTAMNRFINEYRMLSGMHVVYKNEIREMIRLLGEGKILGLLMDQDAGNEGTFVKFFGVPASTATGAAAMARMKGTPIVPAFITRKEDGGHTAVLSKPIFVEKTANRDADVFTITQQLTTIIENHIRQFPNEWFWLHNRWKHTQIV